MHTCLDFETLIMLPVNIRINPPQSIDLDRDALEHIRCFRRQWRHFQTLTGMDKLSEEVKTSVLFLSIGQPASSIVSNFLIPALSNEERGNSEAILNALEKHYWPRNTVAFERHTFNRLKQEPYESIDDFANRIRTQAMKCEFNSELLNFIRDRFLVGLHNANIKNYLVTKSDLTFEEAYNYSKSNEGPIIDSSETVPLSTQLEDNVENNSLPMEVDNDIQVMEVARSEPVVKLEKLNLESAVTRNISKLLPPVKMPLPIKEIKEEILPQVTNNSDISHQTLTQTSVGIQNGCTPTTVTSKPGTIQTSTSNPVVQNKCTPPDFDIGSYVVLKSDLKNSEGDAPIWRIDSSSLLQKFTPCVRNGERIYKSSAVYSGWSSSSQVLYDKVQVTIHTKNVNQKEMTVRLKENIFGKPKLKRKRKVNKS